MSIQKKKKKKKEKKKKKPHKHVCMKRRKERRGREGRGREGEETRGIWRALTTIYHHLYNVGDANIFSTWQK